MYGRGGLDRFKKAQSLEPFSVQALANPNPKPKPASDAATTVAAASATTRQIQLSASASAIQVGGSQSSWQPPDWAIEPRHGVFFLEVLKDGQVLDRIPLDKRRHLFGRQFHACDFLLDHQSVSRQHAAVVPHKNGSVYVIDLGSAHGTFVANERLIKDTPVELEVGQSLRFAASTRSYILRKNEAALFPPTPAPTEINLPPSPDPSDEEAVVAYNTLLNRYGISKSDLSISADGVGAHASSQPPERDAKRMRRTRVAFRDQVGGDLVEVVGVSDGADVETEPGPLGLKEGSLVGKYESLVQITVIPKGKAQPAVKEDNVSPKGVTDKLQEVLNKVKNSSTSKSGIYDDLYGESFSVQVGTSWACSSGGSVGTESSPSNSTWGKAVGLSIAASGNHNTHTAASDDDDDDDLFGD